MFLQLSQDKIIKADEISDIIVHPRNTIAIIMRNSSNYIVNIPSDRDIYEFRDRIIEQAISAIKTHQLKDIRD